MDKEAVVYTYELSPPPKNECESAELRWMNLKSVLHGVKSEREKQTSHINTHMESRKMVLMSQFAGQE